MLLESLGLADRKENPSDRRSRQATITAAGKAMTDQVDLAREKIGRAIFSTWAEEDVANLVRLMRQLADAMNAEFED